MVKTTGAKSAEKLGQALLRTHWYIFTAEVWQGRKQKMQR